MKILFLSGNCVDFASDLLYNGIVEIYGQDNVIDFPYREWHHVKDITGFLSSSSIPMHIPYVYWCSTIDKNSDNRTKYDNNINNLGEIKRLINQNYFDLLIVSNRTVDLFKELFKDNDKKHTNTKIIIINGEDSSESVYHHLKDVLSEYWNNIDLLLQREYRQNSSYDKKVIPYPCVTVPTNLPNLDFKPNKEIDVFCRHGPSHPFRQKVLDRIKQIKGINVEAGYAELPIIDYFKHINNSKISISIGGVGGFETPRYVEIPYMKSMLLAQFPKNALDNNLSANPVIYPNDFKDRYSAVSYKTDLSDIEDLIRYYLKNDKEREEVTRRGYEHVINHLTTKKTVEYVIKNLEDNDYWKSLV